MRPSLLQLALLTAACSVGVTPEPLSGEVPATVAVWPFVAEAHQAEADRLLGSLASPLAARGYRVVSKAVAAEMLRAAGVGDGAEWTQVGQVLGADAVLQFVVRDFTAIGTRPLQEARWDLEWRLQSTRGGGVMWSHTHKGSWFPPQDFADPHRPLDAEKDIVPIGGHARITYRDGDELVASLHRMAMAYLPTGSR